MHTPERKRLIRQSSTVWKVNLRLGGNLLCCLIYFCTITQGQVVRNRSPLVTQTSPLANRLYTSILQDIRSAEFDRASINIESLRSRHAGTLISIDDRHQVEATLLADQLLMQSNAVTTGSPLPESTQVDAFGLWRYLLRNNISANDLIKRGDQLWKQGEIRSAEQHWRLAKNKSNPSTEGLSVDLTNLDIELLKRQIIAHLLTGNIRQAEHFLDELDQQYPDSTGKVAGQEGVLSQILERFAAGLKAGNRDEYLSEGLHLPFEQVRYHLIAHERSIPIQTESDLMGILNPCLWKDVLLLHDSDGVRALNLKTGQPAWPISPEDKGFIFETKSFGDSDTPLPLSSRGAIVHKDVWYGRTGVASLSENRNLDPSQQSRIVALGLEAEGRLEWTRTTNELTDAELTQERIFSGSPTLTEENLIVPLRTSAPSNKLQLACLDSESGDEIWLKDIAASLQPPITGKTLLDRLILDGNVIYWLVDGMALCCIDSTNGQVNWVSAINTDRIKVNSDILNAYDFILFRDEILCTTRNGIASFNKFTGKLNWEHYFNSPPQSCLGIVDGILIVCGPGLHAIDTRTGNMIWTHRQFGLESNSTRPELAGRSIFYPHQHQLFTIDARSGRILQQDSIDNGTVKSISGATLINNLLLIQTQENLQAYRTQLN